MSIGAIVWVVLIIVNIISFVLFYVDKRRAIKHQWRIRETTLFLSAIVGGSVGAIAGMYVFHHKTRHWYFVVGMPLILAVQLVILFLLRKNGII